MTTDGLHREPRKARVGIGGDTSEAVDVVHNSLREERNGGREGTRGGGRQCQAAERLLRGMARCDGVIRSLSVLCVLCGYRCVALCCVANLGVRDPLLVEIRGPEAVPIPDTKLLAAFNVFGDEFHAGERHRRLLDLAGNGARFDGIEQVAEVNTALGCLPEIA